MKRYLLRKQAQSEVGMTSWQNWRRRAERLAAAALFSFVRILSSATRNMPFYHHVAPASLAAVLRGTGVRRRGALKLPLCVSTVSPRWRLDGGDRNLLPDNVNWREKRKKRRAGTNGSA